jgi:hypothetical protein
MSKLHGLTDIAIDRYFHSEPLFGGCLCNNSKLNLKKKQVVILNLQNENQPGTHFVLASSLDSRFIFYCDPFGVGPTKDITRDIKKTGLPCYYNCRDIQALTSDSCGYFCSFIAKKLIRGESPEQALNHFSDSYIDNECILHRYFRII